MGINCPEKRQDYGSKATNKFKELTNGRLITVETKGMDRYKRTLGIVYADDINVNEELLKCGLAWKYKHTKYKPYEKLMQEAKKKRLNIWSQPNPVGPSEWRRAKKGKK